MTTFRYGPCGHPMRADERGSGCRVCNLARLSSDECYGYMDDHSASYRERSFTRGIWYGHEEEANACETHAFPRKVSDEEQAAIEAEGRAALVTEIPDDTDARVLRWVRMLLADRAAYPGHVTTERGTGPLADAQMNSGRIVRYDPVSGEPYAEYMKGVVRLALTINDGQPLMVIDAGPNEHTMNRWQGNLHLNHGDTLSLAGRTATTGRPGLYSVSVTATFGGAVSMQMQQLTDDDGNPPTMVSTIEVTQP